MKTSKNNKFKTNYQLFAGETITDLTNTSWAFNSSISEYIPGSFVVDCFFNTPVTSQIYSYLGIFLNGEPIMGFVAKTSTLSNDYAIFYTPSAMTSTSSVIDSAGWYEKSLDTYTKLQTSPVMTIIGGDGGDQYNNTLIEWLQENAVQVDLSYTSTINLTNCTCNKSSESGLIGLYNATITADDGCFLSSVTSNLGTVTISTNKQSATIDINGVTENFTITATGTAKTIKNVILHPNNRGVTDYTTDIMPEVNSASELEINRLFRTRYTITPTITNGSSSGDEYIWSEETAQITISPEENYSLPSSITVSGASYTYDSISGVVSLSNATGNVSIIAICEAQATGYEVELYGWDGAGETVYVQINDDPTWYYAEMIPILGFATDHTNIPNVYEKVSSNSIGIPNVSKIKIGTQGDPTSYTGPKYIAGSSTGDFTNLTFTSTGGSAPAYVTGEITMTQDSKVYFNGDD